MRACTSEPQSSTFLFSELLDSPRERQGQAFQVVVLVDELLTLLEAADELSIVLVLVIAPLDRMAPEVLAHPRCDRLVQEQVGDVWRLPTCISSCEGTEAILLQGLVVQVHDGAMAALIKSRTAVCEDHSWLRSVAQHICKKTCCDIDRFEQETNRIQQDMNRIP